MALTKAMATLKPHPQQERSISSSSKKGILHKVLALTLSALVLTTVTACSSSAENTEQATKSSTVTAANRTSKSENYGLDRLQDQLYEQMMSEQDVPTWTDANTAMYEQALKNTDLVYDERTASFINVEARPATGSVFERERSVIFDPNNTSVDRPSGDTIPTEANKTQNSDTSSGGSAAAAATAETDVVTDVVGGGDGATEAGRPRSYRLMEVVALAYQAQLNATGEKADDEYLSRWNAIEEGAYTPAPRTHRVSSIKQNKAWWQLGDGPRRYEVNYYDYDPFYYKPWYIRQGHFYHPVAPVYVPHRGPSGGVYFDYTWQ